MFSQQPMSVEEYKLRAFQEQTMPLHVAAGLLGVSIERMRELVYRGDIQGIMMYEGSDRVDRESLKKYMQEQKKLEEEAE